MNFNDEDRPYVIEELRAEKMAARRRSRMCLDTRSPDYEGPDEDEPTDEERLRTAKARKLARTATKAQIVAQLAESLGLMLAAYDAEDSVPANKLEQARIALEAWDFVKETT